MQKKVLIVFETSSLFIDDFQDRLDNQFLNEYIIMRIEPHPKRGKSKMINDCIEEATVVINENKVEAIFVDINISNSEKDNTGVELSLKLKDLFPNIPIFPITEHFSNENAHDIISDATLENFDGVLIKSFLTSGTFSAKRFNKMITKAKEKRTDHLKKEKIDILICCVVPKELEALQLVFNFKNEQPYKIINGIRCWKKNIHQKINSHKQLTVVFTMVGSAGNVLSALFTNTILDHYHTPLAILCGIAAGNKDKISIYSSVVGDAITYYEYQKLSIDNKITYRLNVDPQTSLTSKDIPHIVLQGAKWKEEFLAEYGSLINEEDIKNKEWINEDWQKSIELREGVIASGEKLLADKDTMTELADIIKINKGVIAGEMEGFGFCKACMDHTVPMYFVFRGISDYGGPEKSDPINDKYQNIAALSAATSVKHYIENTYYENSSKA